MVAIRSQRGRSAREKSATSWRHTPTPGVTADLDPFWRIWTPSKTLLPNSGSRTRNKCESTHQFHILEWRHTLPIFSCNAKGSYFLSQSRPPEIFHKKKPARQVLYFANHYSFVWKLLFFCLDEKTNFLFSFSAACASCFLCLFFWLSLRPVRSESKSARGGPRGPNPLGHRHDIQRS